ncbi:hypothetical protein [Aquibaculum arenosum]|uniref:Uncharacterized protein n=1 Tax=Aquibaculum arenosum TaxID=3032591 RepID=A0ABT5YNS6_9PROT|nr:hypothetical protein [Fodinicurvata sp. CAU 1616]MDF2096593.1 hypothetical protein [Fodinicurvata sp. CAU 1616]
MRVIGGAVAHDVDGGAGQEHGHIETGGHPAIGDGEGHGGQFLFGSMGHNHDKLALLEHRFLP